MTISEALGIIKEYYNSNAFSAEETEAFLTLFKAVEKMRAE